MIELVVVVIYWTDCMPRKFGNEIRLPGTTGIDNLPIPHVPYIKHTTSIDPLYGIDF